MADTARVHTGATPSAVLAVCLLVALAWGLALPAAGQGAPQSQEDKTQAALHYFTNVELVNQYGETMRLYSDLLQGKVVLINTMYTTCTGICPVMSKSIEKIQEHVGDRVGKDVYLISISVDPDNDTPEKLKAFADKFHAQRGWYFLTGDKENIAFALQKLGQYTEDPENHQGIIIMGNEPTGLWKKAFGLAAVGDLIDIFDSVLNDDGTTPVTGAGS